MNQDIKLILWGNTGVGKTQMLKRYTQNYYSESDISTIGLNFAVKEVNYHNEKYKLVIWDTAGQIRFREISATMLREPNLILLCFDVTHKQTFLNLENHIELIREKRCNINNHKIFIIGTKMDDTENREVSQEEINKFIKKHKLAYYEVSAKKNQNIENMFNDAILYHLEPSKFQEKHKDVKMDDDYTLQTKTKKKSKWCFW